MFNTFRRNRKFNQLKSAIRDYQNLLGTELDKSGPIRIGLIENVKKCLAIIDKFEVLNYLTQEDYEYLRKYIKLGSNLEDLEEYKFLFSIMELNRKNIKTVLSKIQQLAKELSLSINSVKIELSRIELLKLSKEFYIITKEYIISKTTQKYRDFLKQAGYMDLDSCDGLLIEKKISKTNINQTDGRKLVENQGYKLLTAGIMYLVFIPYLKEKESQEEKGVIETLNEMKNKYAEWLEDQIINKNTLKINNKEIEIDLLKQVGWFDKADLNDYGYPYKLKDSGEFYYWYPKSNQIAAIRGRNSELGLVLDRVPGFVDDELGLRRAKIFIK